jgi:NADPH2:quinone reductase
VRVAVDAFCLNFNDIDIIRGKYQTLPLEPPFTPGMESVGVVERAGPGAEHLLGQRIVGIPTLAHGGYAQFALVDAATAMELPAWVSDADGAALHYPFHLAWFGLHERARVQPGETLLVHAAAGGTGSGAVTMGKALGARVIATAGSDEKLEFCEKLGADFVVNYRSDDFVKVAMDATYGRGVDVAWDTVGGDTTIKTFECMGFNGRHLIAGWSQDIGLENTAYLTPRAMAYGNFSLVGVCLVYVNDPVGTRRLLGFNWPSRAEGQHAHATILEMLRTGKIRTSVTRELSFAEIPQALEDIEQRKTMGRLVAHVG